MAESASQLWESALPAHEPPAPSQFVSQAPAPAPDIPTAAELRAEMMSERKEAQRQSRSALSTQLNGAPELLNYTGSICNHGACQE